MKDLDVKSLFFILNVVFGCILDAVSAGFFLEDQAEITPTDPYPLIGSNLTLTCSLKDIYSGNQDSTDMYFRSRNINDPLPHVRVVDSRTIALDLSNLQQSENGYYRCYIGSTLLTATDVNVGDIPKPISNLTCNIHITPGLGHSMICTWCPTTPSPNRWTLLYKHGLRSYKQCQKRIKDDSSRISRMEQRCSCYWPSSGEMRQHNMNPAEGFLIGMQYKVLIGSENIWSITNGQSPVYNEFTIDTLAETVHPNL